MHTSFQNVLSRTFRQPRAASTGYTTVAAWLAPAVTSRPVPPRRPFSQTRRRRAQPRDTHHDVADPAVLAPKRPNRLSLPGISKRNDPQAWIERLDPFLPPHLAASPATASEPPTTGEEKDKFAREIAWFLTRSRILSSVDILSYLGIEQARWDVVMWIVKTIVEMNVPSQGQVDEISPFGTIKWAGESGSLKLATNNAIVAERVGSGIPFQHTLDQLTDWKDFSEDGIYYRKGSLGQVWRSLGNMILTAEGDRPQDKDAIMAHVLELIAYLHHFSIIPESVYHYVAPKDNYSLQQPPTIYLLSSKILTALSDAAWRAHESAAAPATKSNVHYTLFGREIPGSRFKVHTPELGSEVWLELVLWSCLHGGWVTDGAAILEKLIGYKGEARWSVLHWRNILQDQAGSSFRDMTWTDLWSFARARGSHANSPDRFLVAKTISSEVVAAFVDGMLNLAQLGVGQRGVSIDEIHNRVHTLKGLLEREDLGLGTRTWEAIVVRFLETGAIDFEKHPRLLERALHFVSSYGRELEYNNAPHEHEDSLGSPSYIMDASAISLGILHQALRVHTANGDIVGTFRVIERLQMFTDENKRRSLQKFFEKLNSASDNELAPLQSFESNISSQDYPAYFPQIPTPLLAAVLSLATKSEAYEFARSLLYSEDIDGPLIPEHLYHDSNVAAALLNYGVAVGDRNVILKVVELHRGSINSFRLVESLLDSQMLSDRWDAAENVIRALPASKTGGWTAKVGAVVAKHLLILQQKLKVNETEEVTLKHSLTKAASIFRRLVRGRFGRGDQERLNRFHGILCVLSTVGPEWESFCSTLWVYRETRSLEESLLEEDFHQIVEGVTHGRSSIEGQRLVRKWCADVADAPPLEPPSGPNQMPKERPLTLTRPLTLHLDEVHAATKDDEKIILRGRRFYPSLSTLRVVYRKALEEVLENGVALEDRQELLQWAARGLKAMGLDEKDIDTELGGIVSRGVVHLSPTASKLESGQVPKAKSRPEESANNRDNNRDEKPW